jgi:hypothetical protein
MNKKTKMLLGVGVIAAAAFYLYKNSKKKDASFVSADGCRYTLGKSTSGQSPQVYEICPGKAPRLAREVKTYR